MDFKKIIIISPVSRRKNLKIIKKSINFNIIFRWLIIYDGTKIEKNYKHFKNKDQIEELTYISKSNEVLGNGQRNFGLEYVEKNFSSHQPFIYFLDDDNIVHPNFYNLLKQLENNARAFDMENDGYEDDDGDDPFSDTKSKTSKTSKSNVQVPKLPIAVVEAPSKNAMSKAKPIETEDGGLLTVRSQFTPDFVLAKYVCDFGHVVAGTVRKKKFVVSNTGYLPVTFTIDSGGASSKGFHMDPEKVKNVPEGEDINFKVTFKSKRSRLGPIQVEVPIFLKDGPAIVLILKANVTIPDVSVTPEQGIDFGTVLLGRTKIINFQLKNLAPVPTTWSRAKQTKNAKNFEISQFHKQSKLQISLIV